MGWHITDDADEFLAAAGEFLRVPAGGEHAAADRRDDAAATAGRTRTAPEDPLFGWCVADGGQVDGALLQTPPYPLLLTAVPAGTMPRRWPSCSPTGRCPAVNGADRGRRGVRRGVAAPHRRRIAPGRQSPALPARRADRRPTAAARRGRGWPGRPTVTC